MKNLKLDILICLFVACTIPTFGQTDIAIASNTIIEKPSILKDEPIITAGEKAEADEEKAPESKFSYSGYFDVYYFGNLNKPASRITWVLPESVVDLIGMLANSN